MRKRVFQKLKQNKAFTLLETLIVVAVMVILMGISMIALNEYTTTLKMSELDNYAKTIYLEAQNQLIAEKVEGGLPQLAVKFEAERAESRLPVVPQDYSYDTGDEEWKNLYQISKADELSNCLILEQSYLSDVEGDYIIEFNPQTGIVYGVFYWEKEDAIDYQNDVVRLVDRTREERESTRIGYYGGMTEAVISGSFVLNQQAEIINEEELYLRISYEASPRLLAYYDSSLNVEYIISDEHGNSWTGTVDPSNIFNTTDNIDVVNAGRRLDIYVLLDSMQDGYEFEDIVKDTDLVLDDELTVSVTSVYDHGSDYCVESNAEYPLKCNGLFADASNKSTGQMVQIEKVRHLRNLEKLIASDHIEIKITDHVDFENDEYVWAFTKDTEGNIVKVRVENGASNGIQAQRPIDAFEPISNDAVFVNHTGTVKISADSASIRNFVIKGTADNVGLFAELRDVDLENISIEDIYVDASGCNKVGALVGKMSGGSMDNCGVYLTSFQTKNGVKTYYSQMKAQTGDYSNEMEHRVDTYYIAGKNRVGGLVGALDSVTVSNSYAAINVIASGNNVGGFAGSITGEKQTLSSCYSSGDVVGNENVGGFAGYISNMQIGKIETVDEVTNSYGVYSTSDVLANANMGGFVGCSANTDYIACTGYGLVLLQNGANNVENANGSGFVAVNQDGNTYTDCSYLKQTDYNNKVANKSIVPAKGYGDYMAASDNDISSGMSYPYDVNLYSTAFPFAIHWPEQPHHYGDWPSQYVINTSLVYYEKYTNGKDENGNPKYLYGFYCITYIAGSEKQWLLNTLQDKECVEDGYALLTKFNLESIEYDLQIGSVVKSDPTVDSNLLLEGQLNETEGSLVRLVQQKDVEFVTCDNAGNIISNEKGGETFNVSGMYLYQLPYELQCTERSGVDNFYDRLVFNKGVIYDSDPYADDIVVIDNLTFFYCPHFAKTAVNPNLSRANDLSTQIYPNPEKVAVRSARQLNALGRFSYYWNTRLGYDENLSFVQETDVNFGTYVKEYCGKEFNLLAFDQPYSNRPIGEWDGDASGKGSFMNDYDGQCHKIIDYCVKSDQQYVGLFGEVYKAGGAKESQIRNIVMVVSNKETTPNYDVEGISVMEQNNAGLILGTFLDYSGKSKGERKRTGIGALVGSDYTVGQTEGEASVFTIQNCAAAGYTVAYELDTVGNKNSAESNAPQQPLGIAIGGLIGYGRGNIESSTAVNTVKFIAKEDYTGDNAAIFMGGFGGSLYYGTVQNCYAGGEITVDNGTGTRAGSGDYYIIRMRAGGFCPGWLDAPGLRSSSSEKIRYQDIYAYTTVTDNMWKIREESGTGTVFTYFIPVVGRMVVSYERVIDHWVFIVPVYADKWTTSTEIATDVRMPGMSYVLNDIYNDAYSRQDETVRKLYIGNGVDHTSQLSTCHPVTYDELSDLEGLYNNSLSGDFIRAGKGQAYSSYPISDYLQSMAYPFPAVIKDADGKYVHYGDWPVKQETVTTQFPAYYEKYVDKDGEESIGYLMMRADGSTECYLITESETVKVKALPGDEKEITETGYGFLKMAASKNPSENDETKRNALFKTTVKNGVDGGMYYYYYQKVTDWTGTGVDVNANDRCEVLDFSFSTVKASNGEVLTGDNYELQEHVKQIYINPNFAGAISLNASDLGTDQKPLQVRTQTQLTSVKEMNEPDVYMQMTHSVAVDDTYMPIELKDRQVFDGGSESGFAIRGAKTTIFQNNTGTIQNVTVINSDIDTAQNTAIFVHTNAGTIRNVKVENSSIHSTGIVAGFVYNNTGLIEYSGIHATTGYDAVLMEGVRAYGFVVDNADTTAVIRHCYVTGSVTGAAEAAGFVRENAGNISLSYANAMVHATVANAKAAGFGLNAGTVENAYAAGNVVAVEVYGFMEDGTAESCYTISQIDGTTEHGFAGTQADTHNCFWGYDVKAEYNTALMTDINQPPEDAIMLRELMRGVDDYEMLESEETAKPYSDVLGKRYPYPLVGIPHYGDWKAPTAEINDTNTDDQWRLDFMNGANKYAGIFYFERYMDGSYGYFLKGVNSQVGGTLIDLEIFALADDEETVVTSGYGVFYQDTRWDILWDEDIRNDITDFDGNVLEDFHIEGIEDAYQYRYLNKDGLKNAFTRTLYYGLFTNNTITIWENEITDAKN